MWPFALAAAVGLGLVLRLVWVRDMEYKWDEAWTFEQTQEVGQPFPWLGMPSSLKVANPGMSLWVFLLLGKLCAVHEPTDLARVVQVLSVVAILVLIFFALRWVAREEREPWLWAAAFLAVNPLAVLFHRKIWPPSVLPIFVSFMLVSWWQRDRRWGAFAWGLLGMCLGQIHMGGFFLAAGFVLWALLFDRKHVAWRSWLAGSCLGAVFMLPWLATAAASWGQRPIPHYHWYHVLIGRFWARWVTEPFGFGLDYALENDFADFLHFPHVGGRPTYLVGLLHGLILVTGLCILARRAVSLARSASEGSSTVSPARSASEAIRRWRFGLVHHMLHPAFLIRQSPTALTQNAALWGFGIILSLSCLPIYRHYMVIAYPLEFLWLARLALPQGERDKAKGERQTTHSPFTLFFSPSRKVGRALLLTLCVAQALLSAGFLSYIHSHQSIHGAYGVAYGSQKESPLLKPHH